MTWYIIMVFQVHKSQQIWSPEFLCMDRLLRGMLESVLQHALWIVCFLQIH